MLGKKPLLSTAKTFNFLYPKTDREDSHTNKVSNEFDSLDLNEFFRHDWFRGEWLRANGEIYRRADEIERIVSECLEEIEERQSKINDFLDVENIALDKDGRNDCIKFLKENLSAYWALNKNIGLKVTALSEARQAAKKEDFLYGEAFKRGYVNDFEKEESDNFFKVINSRFQFSVKDRCDSERALLKYVEYANGVIEKIMDKTAIDNVCDDLNALNHSGDSVVGCDGFMDGGFEVFRHPEEAAVNLIGQNYLPTD